MTQKINNVTCWDSILFALSPKIYQEIDFNLILKRCRKMQEEKFCLISFLPSFVCPWPYSSVIRISAGCVDSEIRLVCRGWGLILLRIVFVFVSPGCWMPPGVINANSRDKYITVVAFIEDWEIFGRGFSCIAECGNGMATISGRLFAWVNQLQVRCDLYWVD